MGYSLDAVGSLRILRVSGNENFRALMACLASAFCSTRGEVLLRPQTPAEAASLSAKLSLSLPQFRVMVMESTPMGKE